MLELLLHEVVLLLNMMILHEIFITFEKNGPLKFHDEDFGG